MHKRVYPRKIHVHNTCGGWTKGTQRNKEKINDQKREWREKSDDRWDQRIREIFVDEKYHHGR